MRRTRDFLVASLAVAALSATACTAGAAPTVEDFFTVPGGQVHLRCDGGEGPTVMLISALGGDHSLRAPARELHGEANVCFYDRPGDGETEPPADPRTAAEDAADLHALLATADIPTPVVLVAHSYGGLISIVAAATHPEDVAGVVFVDASHPDQEGRLKAVLSPEQAEGWEAELDNFPYVDWHASLADAAAAYPDFPDIPVTVITAERGFLEGCTPGMPCDELQAVWLEVQEEYAAISPDARHVLVDAGHYIHDDDPDLVISEIRALLERIGA